MKLDRLKLNLALRFKTQSYKFGWKKKGLRKGACKEA